MQTPNQQPPLSQPDMAAPVMNTMPVPEHGTNPSLLNKVGDKVGKLATSAYEFTTLAAARLQGHGGAAAEGKQRGGNVLRYGTAAVVMIGGFAVKAYANHHGVHTGGGAVASPDVMGQVNHDHANFELVADTTPTHPHATEATPSPDPAFDHEDKSNYGPLLVGAALVAGGAAVVGSTIAVSRRARRDRHAINLGNQHDRQNAVIRQSALDANAVRNAKWAGSRRTDAPLVDHRNRRLPFVDGTPLEEAAHRNYRPSAAVPGPRAPSGRFRRLFRSRNRLRTPKP